MLLTDYASIHRIAVRSLQQLDADMKEQRPMKEIEREAHKFASVIVDVFGALSGDGSAISESGGDTSGTQ
jgi:hypothetical protein